nr:FHA domain-containing protein [Chloroflexota bacterium]
MWLLTTRSSSGQPQEYSLKPGNNTLGRSPENDIVVADRSASRAHAEIYYDADADTATLVDLQSLNGTFVNRERVAVPVKLEPDDTIRIGEHVIAVAVRRPEPPKPAGVASGTQALTRDALLESLDNQAVLMYEVSRKLNMVTDLDMALYEVSTLLMTSMGADRCQVVLA